MDTLTALRLVQYLNSISPLNPFPRWIAAAPGAKVGHQPWRTLDLIHTTESPRTTCLDRGNTIINLLPIGCENLMLGCT